jgi:hypothetical protein
MQEKLQHIFKNKRTYEYPFGTLKCRIAYVVLILIYSYFLRNKNDQENDSPGTELE